MLRVERGGTRVTQNGGFEFRFMKRRYGLRPKQQTNQLDWIREHNMGHLARPAPSFLNMKVGRLGRSTLSR